MSQILVGDVDLGAAGNVLRAAGTDFISVVTRAGPYASGLRLAIAQEERDRIIRMTGLRPVRSFHFAAIRENNLNNPLRVRLVIILVAQLVQFPVAWPSWG